MKRVAVIITIFNSIMLAQFTTYVLCEGNYGSLNASLWSLNPLLTEINGPIYWNQSTNPLGDTGQNLKIHHDRLFIIMNNSNTIEIADISAGFEYLTTVDLPLAGPRDIEVVDNIAFVSCWYLGGIIAINLDSYAIIDTLNLGALPEDLLYYNDKLYATITMNADWSSSNRVIEFQIADFGLVPVDTFIVVAGPEEMIGHRNCLYVSSTYYDSDWNTHAGNSRIDLSTGMVVTKDFGITFSFGRDITVLNDKVYRTYRNGICALTDSLTMNPADQIGNFTSIYSMASHDNLIYLGLSNYVAPDTVIVTDTSGNQIAAFPVGAIPGSFAFYEPGSAITKTDNIPFPAGFQLSQNYPNPFNGVTVIPFQINQPGHYTLKVYNIIGQQVAVLHDSETVTGNYRILWNGRNQHGSVVANGLYHALLESDRHRQMIKILFLK